MLENAFFSMSDCDYQVSVPPIILGGGGHLHWAVRKVSGGQAGTKNNSPNAQIIIVSNDSGSSITLFTVL